MILHRLILVIPGCLCSRYCKFGNLTRVVILEFCEDKTIVKSLFPGVGKSCHSRKFLMWQICLFNAICENKILAKISKFTVPQFHDLVYICLVEK